MKTASKLTLSTVVICCIPMAVNAETDFDFSRTDIGCGIAPYSITLADLNGDGLLDVVITNSSVNHPHQGDTVTVLLTDESGLFHFAQYPTGLDPTSAVVGDFNGDGVPDIVTSNGSTNSSISVLLGNGDGTFMPRVDHELHQPWNTRIAAGDLDGDGVLDLVVTHYTSHTMSVLLGNGDGTFQEPLMSSTTYSSGFALLADFNGDGYLDLAVTSVLPHSVGIFLGNGDGTFQPRVDFPAGHGTAGLAVGDFNGDGALDLAVSNLCPDTDPNCLSYLPGTVSVLLGIGDGTFQSQVVYVAGVRAGDVAVGDFDGDGNADLVVANNLAGSISVHLGNGDGTFRNARFYNVGDQPNRVAVGNFGRNLSGPNDVVTANLGGYNGKTISVLRNSARLPP